ncbi:MAG: hypothetical protein ACI89X_001496 [Planctomycetota bacterium]|jgi:hypothetical protein
MVDTNQADELRDGAPEQRFEREVAAVQVSYRLAMSAARFRGRIGSRRGSGPGSSLEFHDFRDYAPGDDLRHVDWSGYARTDQLRVRLHEAEVAPIVEVLVDTSTSMAITDAKLATLRGLTLALHAWARGEGSVARIMALGGGELDPESFAAGGGFVCNGSNSPEMPGIPLRAGSVRILLTDALWPTDPSGLLGRIASGASRFACLQLLDPWERAPSEDGGVTLVDCESGERQALRLDQHALRTYGERLQRLCASLHETVVRLGGEHVPVTAADLPTVCSRDLVPARIVEPA